jgi:hypothetical protein
VLLKRGVPSEDHHDCVLSEKRCCVALDGGFIDLHAPGYRPHGHETLHHVVVSKVVIDGVGVIQTCFFEELLEVVLRRSYLVLAIAYGLCGMFSAGATCPLIDAAVDVDCGPLATLFAPLLVGLGALLGTLGGDIG